MADLSQDFVEEVMSFIIGLDNSNTTKKIIYNANYEITYPFKKSGDIISVVKDTGNNYTDRLQQIIDERAEKFESESFDEDEYLSVSNYNMINGAYKLLNKIAKCHSYTAEILNDIQWRIINKKINHKGSEVSWPLEKMKDGIIEIYDDSLQTQFDTRDAILKDMNKNKHIMSNYTLFDNFVTLMEKNAYTDQTIINSLAQYNLANGTLNNYAKYFEDEMYENVLNPLQNKDELDLHDYSKKFMDYMDKIISEDLVIRGGNDILFPLEKVNGTIWVPTNSTIKKIYETVAEEEGKDKEKNKEKSLSYAKKLRNILEARESKIQKLGNTMLQLSNADMLNSAYQLLAEGKTGNEFKENLGDIATNPLDQKDFLSDFINRMAEIIKEDGTKAEDKRAIRFDGNNKIITLLKPVYNSDGVLDTIELEDDKLKQIFDARAVKLNTLGDSDYLVISNFTMLKNAMDILEFMKLYSLTTYDIIHALSSVIAVTGNHPDILKLKDDINAMINQELNSATDSIEDIVLYSIYDNRHRWMEDNMTDGIQYLVKSQDILNQIYRVSTNLYKNKMINRIIELLNNNKPINEIITYENNSLHIKDKEDENSLDKIYKECQEKISKDYANKILWEIHKYFPNNTGTEAAETFRNNIKLLYIERMMNRIHQYIQEKDGTYPFNEQDGKIIIKDEDLKAIHEECKENIDASYANKLLWQLHGYYTGIEWKIDTVYSPKAEIYRKIIFDEVLRLVILDYNSGNSQIDKYPIYKIENDPNNNVYIQDGPQFDNLRRYRDESVARIGTNLTSKIFSEIYQLMTDKAWVPEKLVLERTNYYIALLKAKITNSKIKPPITQDANGSLIINDIELKRVYQQFKVETSEKHASDELIKLYNEFVEKDWFFSDNVSLCDLAILTSEEESYVFENLILLSDVIKETSIFNNINNCAENCFKAEMLSNDYSNPLANKNEWEGDDYSQIFVEKMCEIIEGNLLKYDEKTQYLISPLVQTSEGAIVTADTTTGQAINNILEARQNQLDKDDNTNAITNAELLSFTYNVLRVMKIKGYGIDYFKEQMYEYVLKYKEISDQDFSRQFVERMCSFIASQNIEYNYNTTSKKYIPIFPLVKDEEGQVRIVNSKGGEMLASILNSRQKKMDLLGDEANFIISNKNMLIKAYDILVQLEILYNQEKNYIQCVKAFRELMFEDILDSDYAQGIIDTITNDFYQASRYNLEETKLDNKYFTENSDGSITINHAGLKVILDNRKEKIKNMDVAVHSNDLLIQLIVQAIHESNRDVNKFRTKIKEKLNPDYSLTIIEYLYNNFKTAKDKEYIVRIMKGRNEFFEFNNYENNENYTNQNKEAVEYLKELFELRETKRKLDQNLSKKTVDNEMLMQAIIGKNFYECNDRESFKKQAKKAIEIDYSMWMIEIIYSHYTLNNKIRFDDWNHIIFPIKENDDKNFYIIDKEMEEEEETKEFLQILKNYYDLRADKIERLDIEYISNQDLLNYIGISLNATNSNIEFYNEIISRLKLYHEGEGSIGTEGPIEYDNSAKLYPPSINGTLPAFCEDEYITIPFVMNKTVSWNQIKGFSIRVKNIQTNAVIQSSDSLTAGYSKETLQAYFTYDSEKFNTGSFYKVQIAYISKDDVIGFYSTVGIIKYTKKPKVKIEGLTNSQLHADIGAYIGSYSQKGMDVSEKVYSYNFTIYDENKDIIETSGELLHNHENDKEIYESSDLYKIKKTLKENKIYTIIYTVTTANGLVVSSPKYRITSQSTIDPEVEAQLSATMNQENGYIDLQLIGNKNEMGIEKVGTGTFLICRASSEDDFGSWTEINRFALFGERPSERNWKDFTIQHGFTYVYSLQQYNKDYQIYSNRMLSNKVTANFEHSFLYDGKRQLKIKYNPKVTSFKETLLEQKTNTLGGKYPFFFRNANVGYKEFPISGLISYLSDEEELFLTNEDLFLEDLSGLTRKHTLKESVKSTDYEYFNDMLDANMAYKLQEEYRQREKENSQENQITRKKDRTTNLTDYNTVAERIFKMKVLDFLNDGKPKLFRSPGEGNYIVRLMNSSLAPNDTLGRMIHTFTTSATEIDDYNYEKLNEYSFIQIDEPDTKQLRWKTVDIRELINQTLQGLGENETIEDWISIGGENEIQSIQFIDMKPGSSFKIEFPAGDEQQELQIQIGTTGAYYTQFENAIKRLLIPSSLTQGQVTYSFYGNSLHHFDTYRYIKTADIPVIQLRGSSYDLDIKKYFNLEDIKYRVTKYYFLNFIKDYEWSKDLNKLLQNLKEAYLNHKEFYINEKGEKIDIRTLQKYEAEKRRIEEIYDSNKYKFWIDGKEFDISITDQYQLVDLNYVPEIKLGPGIALDASIQRREIEYDIEENDQEVKEAKDAYTKDVETLSDIITGEITNLEEYELKLNSAIREKNNSYKQFIELLEKALEQKEVYIN